MTLNLAQLRAFVAVVDEGGFGAAAPVLGISQSAVSHAVAALERTVGAPVLYRGAAPATPTTIGVQLLEHARTALAATQAIMDLAATHRDSPVGLLRLAAPPTVCHGLLPELVATWKADFPRVSVKIFEGEDDEVETWLSGGTVDAAVLINPDGDRGALLGTDEFQALLRADHPLAGESELHPADLTDDPLLLCSCTGCERQLRELYRLAALPLTATHWVSGLSTQLDMVREGLGISIVPDLIRSMIGDELVLVPLNPTVRRRLILTGPPQGSWHPSVTALIGSLERQLDDVAPAATHP